MSSSDVPTDTIEAVRRFNRFYTRHIGLLRRTFLDTPHTLGEMRVLQEIVFAGERGETITASEIGATLGFDAGYMSRMLKKLERGGLLSRTPCCDDARQSLLSLTAAGRRVFDKTNTLQAARTRASLAGLSAAERKRLVVAMQTIEALLGEAPPGEDATA